MFGLTRDELLDMTPAGYRTLVEQGRLKRKQDGRLFELMTAQLTAMVANTGFKGWEEPRKAEEFMPSECEKRAAEKPKRMTRNLKVDIARAWRFEGRRIAGLAPDVRKFL